jgi:voltage-gated potassium channel
LRLVVPAKRTHVRAIRASYWTIVTITTVGYGDITPASPFGQDAVFCKRSGAALPARAA